MIAAPAKPLGLTLLDRIGNTPLLRLEGLTQHPGVQILGKAEWTNPGGSVKDRAASAIVSDAIRQGQLTPGSSDKTLGGTQKHCSTPPPATPASPTPCSARPWASPSPSASPPTSRPSARTSSPPTAPNVIWTDPADGSDGAIRMARKLIADEPDRYFYADQYGNDNNWRAHYYAHRQRNLAADRRRHHALRRRPRHLRHLHGHHPPPARAQPQAIRCISMQPDSPFNGLEGLKHMATAIVPPIYDPTLADRNIDMPTERAYAMCKRLARTQGLLLGISAGAAVAAARDSRRRRSPRRPRSRHRHHPPRLRRQIPLRPLLVRRSCGREIRKQRSDIVPHIAEPLMNLVPRISNLISVSNLISLMSLILSRALYDDLRAHGEATYPNECCGILLGRADADGIHVTSLLRAGNTRTDSAHNRYHIAPEELIAAQRQARNSGLDIVGFYHSHPDHPAQWSTHRLRRGPLVRLRLRHHRHRKGQGRTHQLLPALRHQRRRQALRSAVHRRRVAARPANLPRRATPSPPAPRQPPPTRR